jgi:CxxC motif-containing protein (DUF1111 family)
MSARRGVKNATGACLALLLVACSSSESSRQLIAEPSGQVAARWPGAALGGAGTVSVSNQHAFGRSLSNLPVESLRDFAYGNRVFNTSWVTAPASVADFDGLGPLFNRASCTGCHVRDGRGRAPSEPGGRLDSALVRLSYASAPGDRPKPHPIYGSQLQDKAILGHRPEARVVVRYDEVKVRYPDGEQRRLSRPRVLISDHSAGASSAGLLTSFRVAPAVHGLGLLEAISEADLRAGADPSDLDQDGISGRIHSVIDRATGARSTGRFGWKAGQPSLVQQAAAAFAGDIGITSRLFLRDERTEAQRIAPVSANGGDPELRDRDLERLEFYLRSLAVPARRGVADPVVRRGQRLFRELGCASCHRETFVTRADAALPALSAQTIHPYTDLLLHDMGPELADGRPEGEATGQEWRTPPLWGVGLIRVVNGHQRLLHDGRAEGFEDAILWHGGEASESRRRFMDRSRDEREALIRFLEGL